MMSVSRLRYICEQVVKIKPDLVLLTGDFFTIEAYGGGYGVPSNSTAIIESLSPLLSLPGRCFACLGVLFLFFFLLFLFLLFLFKLLLLLLLLLLILLLL